MPAAAAATAAPRPCCHSIACRWRWAAARPWPGRSADRTPYAFAALKSLPFAAEEHGAATLPAQLALAERLAAELEAEGAGWPAGEQQLAAQQQGGSGDPRIAAAQAYQSERQALVQAALLLLRGFLVGSPQPGGYTDRYEQLKAAGAGQQA